MLTAHGNGVRWWRVAAVVVAAGSLTLSGCSKSNESGSAAGGAGTAVKAQKVDEIAAAVPEDIRKSGKLVVGVNIPYAPNEFKDGNGQLVGFDVELMNAVAATMGLSADFREADFAKIIPSIQQGTFNVGMSSFTDTKEREQSVDFVDYFTAGIQWATRAGTTIDPNDACGKKVAVQATTTEDTEELPAKSKKCVEAGKPEIQIVKFDSQDGATNAVILGQVDAMSADSPVTAYAIKQSNGKLETAGDLFEAAPYGWPVKKDSPLGPVMLKALQHLISTGEYKTIAANWGVERGMLDKPVINGATG